MESGSIYAIADETTDREERYICNVLVGQLLEDKASPPCLISVNHLVKTNCEAISHWLDECLMYALF